MNIRNLIPHNLVNILKHYPTGILANLAYGFPSKNLKIIGVTGTDGKTTTATMLYHVLKDAGKKVALISTVSAIIGDKELDTGFHVTSPNHFPLQKFLRQISDQKIEYVVLEATSHGFAQHRFLGIKFLAGIVTNITEDHYLYHGNWHNYATAKSKLFANVKYSILNIDDKSYKFLKARASGKIITYGLKEGDFNLKNFPIKLNILGDYNYYNALAVVTLASSLNIDKKIIRKSLSKFKTVEGRMQVMHKKPLVIVDFAHTPNALDVALKSFDQHRTKDSRIISVFGCAGHRDVGRRRMGHISGKNADITIITAEDPREEGVEAISENIANWAEKSSAKEFKPRHSEKDFKSDEESLTELNNALKKSHLYVRIPDRQHAINFAISIAKPKDIVGIFGKGHEKSMCFGKTETSWSDQKAVIKVISRQEKLAKL